MRSSCQFWPGSPKGDPCPARRQTQLRSSVVQWIDGDARGAAVVLHGHTPRLTTHRAILDVLLRRTAAGIEGDRYLFGAVWAQHGRREISGTVAKRKVVLEW